MGNMLINYLAAIEIVATLAFFTNDERNESRD
jgi:hypothetical protein